MSQSLPRRNPARVAAVLLALALAGCSTATKPTGTGDVAGLRLMTFASDRGNAAGQYDIYLWDFDAHDFRAVPGIVSTAAERHPSITSDGRFIAYQVDRGSAGDNIEVYDRRNQTVDPMPEITTSEAENEPQFSGDGSKLCFTQTIGGAMRRIRLFDGPTRSLVTLTGIDTTGTYSDYSPSPNRDASQIAFVSTRNGAPDIFIYDRNRKAVLNSPKLNAALVSAGDDVDPSFSQSGRFLAFSSNRPSAIGGYDVYLLEFTNTGTIVDTVLVPITAANSVSDERRPAVSDNGDDIVFQTNRAGGQGRLDLYDYRRSTGSVIATPGFDSNADDIEPQLKWPY